MDATLHTGRRGRTLGAATTPDRVHRLRTAVAAAARGENLLLCTELSDPTPAAAESTGHLATLAAFTLAYAGGLPVTTVLAVPDAPAEGPAEGPVEARDRASLLGLFTGDRAAPAEGPIGQVGRWLSRLPLGPRPDAAEAAFLDRMTKAWAFAMACGGEATAVARVLSSDRFLAWPAATSAHPRLVRQNPASGARYGLLSPAVWCPAGAPQRDTRRVAGLTNPVVLRLRPGMRAAELARLCARLDPGREPGRLVLLTPPTPDRRLAGYVAATAGHQPAWVLGGGTGPRLRRMRAVLTAHGAHLGGVSLGGKGRRLDQVVRLATELSSQSTVSILDHTMTGATG